MIGFNPPQMREPRGRPEKSHDYLGVVLWVALTAVAIFCFAQCSHHSGGFAITDEITGKEYRVPEYWNRGRDGSCVTFQWEGRDMTLCDRYHVAEVR